jgi:hypothetical protein
MVEAVSMDEPSFSVIFMPPSYITELRRAYAKFPPKPHFHWIYSESLYYYNDRLAVPSQARTVIQKILQFYHDSPAACHFGTRRTLDLIRRDFFLADCVSRCGAICSFLPSLPDFQAPSLTSLGSFAPIAHSQPALVFLIYGSHHGLT